MKLRYLLGGFITALLGAVIALFAYTKIVEKRTVNQIIEQSRPYDRNAEALLTSLSMQEGQIDFTYAAEMTVHAVVHVRTKSVVAPRASNPFFDFFYGDRYTPRPREVKGYGSGVIISEDGYIITNDHVIDDAENVEVRLNDKRVFEARIIGKDPTTDIALLKIDAKGLPFIKYGDSDKLRLGEWVLAVGNPFSTSELDLTSTVTAGIVSAKGRNLNILDSELRIESFIQTDAALNMGNSGGALVDTKGLLVGITSAIVSPSGAYAGNSFAIPISLVSKVVDDLKQYGEVQRAIIGVNITEVSQEDADKLKLPGVRGARITGVVPDGAAEAAGLKENDIIVSIDGKEVNSPSELQEYVSRKRPGEKASITYFRNGKRSTITLTMRNVAGNTGIVTPGMGAGSTVYGARLEALEPADMKKYDIDHGVKVADVSDGRFKDLGIKKGYIILNVNGKDVKSASDVRQATSGGKDLRSIEGIQSNGTIFRYSFRN
ncbi:MAG TPA: Do family serine endopeptidase [Bacteroidales bacterium]|nr:Do family serine endopeptidase [Bacteroidales bacterium]HOG57185.1 Do family serine endopeptidase [Bacteroidales bacterium]